MNLQLANIFLPLLFLLCLHLGQPKAPVKCKKLCTEFSQKRIPQKLLKTYRKTEPSCPKAAIIFVTQKNKEFCADPEASWVKEAVRQLNQASAPLNPRVTRQQM
ncbi:eotaxin-like [Malaclemys terrapin pileata]|uniref:eotaxin-like n=1 Tax=Malaclemys terrapin pileata TaxID=2991368 RepID=UPI0023A7B7C5|nr:eotaxin-like [Malaclemys terrapin pileata]